MTEKRFKADKYFEVLDNDEFLLSFDQAVDLLNQLNDENEQLKSKYSEQCIQLDFLKDENQHMRDLVNENEQLKQQINKLEVQLYCPFDSICIQCNNEYLVQTEKYYISKCKKGHEQCSKVDVKYCDDFELKGDVE